MVCILAKANIRTNQAPCLINFFYFFFPALLSVQCQMRSMALGPAGCQLRVPCWVPPTPLGAHRRARGCPGVVGLVLEAAPRLHPSAGSVRQQIAKKCGLRHVLTAWPAATPALQSFLQQQLGAGPGLCRYHRSVPSQPCVTPEARGLLHRSRWRLLE